MTKTAALTPRTRETARQQTKQPVSGGVHGAQDAAQQHDGVTLEQYQAAQRGIGAAQDAVRIAREKVKSFHARINDRVTAHDPARPSTHYSLQQREQDGAELGKLKARAAQLEAVRDKLSGVISRYETAAGARQYTAACRKMQRLAAQGAPEARKAVEAVKTLVAALERLSGAHAEFQRERDGNARSGRRQLEDLGTPLPIPLPEFGVMPAEITNWFLIFAKTPSSKHAAAVLSNLDDLLAKINGAGGAAAAEAEEAEQETAEDDTAAEEAEEAAEQAETAEFPEDWE